MRDGTGRRRRRELVALGIVAASVAVAGCGSSDSSSSDGSAISAQPVAAAGKPVETAGVCKRGSSALQQLPAAQQKWYVNVDAGVQTCVSPYAKWLKPKGKPPWTIGYAGTYSGNTWRQLSLQRIQALAAESRARGRHAALAL
jgi:hypothetical protein